MHRLLLIKASNDIPAVTYPLGLMSLSSSIKKAREDIEIRLVDLHLAKESLRTLQRTLEEFKPTLVGVSALSVECASMEECATLVKKIDSRIPVIVGGPHASSDPKGTLQDYPNVDFVCTGEGEITFLEWLKVWEGETGDYAAVEGLHWRGADGAIMANPPRPYIEDLDALPWPDYEIVDLNDYWNEWSMSLLHRYHQYANLFTSRACPYKCTYCHDIFGKGFNARSVESVLAEMKHLYENYGVDEFEILDDIFNWDAQRAKDIFRGVLDLGIKAIFTFPNGLRTDKLDIETLDLFKAAGVRHISIAVETASERLQKQIKKNLKIDVVKQMIGACHERGILTRGFFMIGFPSETREEILKTIDFAVESKLTQAYFFVVIPYEGTELADQNRELVDSMDIQYEKINYFNSDYNMASIPDKELIALKKKAMMRFYLSPKRVWYIYKTSPSFWKFLAFGLSGFRQVLLRLVSLEKINWRKVFARAKEIFSFRPKAIEERSLG